MDAVIGEWSETIDDEVKVAIEEYCERENVADLRKASQLVFIGGMMYVGRKLFKGTNRLKVDPNRIDRGNMYDRGRLNYGVDYYKEICSRYDKIFTLSGLTAFLGVGRNFFDMSGDSSSVDGMDALREKIYQYSEDTNEEALISPNRQPVGLYIRLKNRHGWSDEPKGRRERKQEVISGSDLPRLGMIDGD